MLGDRGMEDRFGLCEQHQRWLDIGVNEITVGHAAGHLQIDQAFGEVVARHQLAVDRFELVHAAGLFHVNLGQRAFEPRGVAGEIQHFAVNDRGYFVDGVSHQKATVKDRDFGVFLGQVVAVYIYNSAHAYPHSSAVGG